MKNSGEHGAESGEQRTDTFEKILWIIILVLAFFAGMAQWDMKKEHDEKVLKRQLMYKQFLEQGECRIQGAQGSRIPVNFTRTLESLNPRTLYLKRR